MYVWSHVREKKGCFVWSLRVYALVAVEDEATKWEKNDQREINHIIKWLWKDEGILKC